MSILSIDVGIAKLGYCVLEHNKVILEMQTISIQPDKSFKGARYSKVLIENINEFIKTTTQKYNVQNYLIEQQIGKFSHYQIQLLLHQSIMHHNLQSTVTIMSPKCKLKMKFVEFIPDTSTLKYTQNKHQSLVNAQEFLKQTGQDFKLTYDSSDALLQGLYWISCQI